MIPYISHADATLQSSDQAEMMTAFIMRVTPQLPLLKAESARRKTERELGEAEHKLLLERLRIPDCSSPQQPRVASSDAYSQNQVMRGTTLAAGP